MVHDSNTHRKCLEALEQYFKQAKHMDQREVVIVLHLLCGPCLPSCRNGMTTIFARAKALVRLDIPCQHPELIASRLMDAIRGEFDTLLARCFLRFLVSVDLATFWTDWL